MLRVKSISMYHHLLIILTAALWLSGCTPSEDVAVTEAGQAVGEFAIVTEGEVSDGIVPLEGSTISDFTLTDTSGSAFSLSDLAGRYVVVYFGFTYCPDFCPTSMADYRLIMRDLGDQADEVAFVFISVDPKRDTPENLARYLSRFDPDIIGLTVSVAEDEDPHAKADDVVRPIVDEFGAFFQINDTGESPYYSVDHTATKFLLDPEGRLIAQYAYGADVRVIADDLRARLADG